MKPRLVFRLILGDDIAPGPGKVQRLEAASETRARKATEVALAKLGRYLKAVPWPSLH